MQKLLALSVACLAVFSASILRADDDVKTESVLDGLDNPCGVAIQPETGDVFVSDSGAAKIIRVVDGKAEDVVTDFPLDTYGKGPMYSIGPLGLAFLNKTTLVVGGGGLADGEELLRVYEIGDAGAEAKKADDMKASFKLAPSEETKGEGNFYALAVNETGVFVTCNGDDTKGWVGKAAIKDGNLASFERFLPTKEAVNVDAPVGATFNPRGHLVIGQMGEITVPEDSLLSFYNPNTGKLLMNLETGLSDITALAYSPTPKPKKRQLYALDFAWHDTAEGGLFKMVKSKTDDGQGVECRKLASLDKPTAMAFGADGTLYIAVLGTAEEGSDAKPGKLLKIAPGL